MRVVAVMYAKLRRLIGDGTPESTAEAMRLVRLTPDPVARAYVRHHAPARMLGDEAGGDGGNGYGCGYDGNRHGDGCGDGNGDGDGGGRGKGNGNGKGDGCGDGDCGVDGNGNGNGDWIPCKEDEMSPGLYIIKMDHGLDYAAQVVEVNDKWVNFGLAAVLRRWGTSRGLGEALNNATLGTYDPAQGFTINLDYVIAWVPIPPEHHDAWMKRLAHVCLEGGS